MNTFLLKIVRLGTGLAVMTFGVTSALMPSLAGIPLILAGLALIACDQPGLDGAIARLENWRHARLHPAYVRVRRSHDRL